MSLANPSAWPESDPSLVAQFVGRQREAGAKAVELHGQHRDALADIVVQIPCNPRTLAFFGAEQPRVADLQLRLAGAQLRFRTAATPALHEQLGDQRRLRQQQHDRADNVAFVAIPHRQLAKSDDGAWRDPRFADAPPPNLAPVHHPAIEIRRRHRDAVGALSIEDAKRYFGERVRLRLLALHAAAHDAVADRGVDPGICRRVRDRRDAVHVLRTSSQV